MIFIFYMPHLCHSHIITNTTPRTIHFFLIAWGDVLDTSQMFSSLCSICCLSIFARLTKPTKLYFFMQLWGYGGTHFLFFSTHLFTGQSYYIFTFTHLADTFMESDVNMRYHILNHSCLKWNEWSSDCHSLVSQKCEWPVLDHTYPFPFYCYWIQTKLQVWECSQEACQVLLGFIHWTVVHPLGHSNFQWFSDHHFWGSPSFLLQHTVIGHLWLALCRDPVCHYSCW